jgi:hypothetical protein
MDGRRMKTPKNSNSHYSAVFFFFNELETSNMHNFSKIDPNHEIFSPKVNRMMSSTTSAP